MQSTERIGVVLVHGIGEQRRFEHLSSEVRNLIAVLKADKSVRISVQTASTRDSEVLAERESWRAEEQAPVRIDLRYLNGSQKGHRASLHIHEVWWADLDDKETLLNRIKFWFWALGMWGAKRFTRRRRPGAKTEMRPPVFPPFPGGERAREGIARLRLLGVAVVFLLCATTLSVINFLLKRLRLGRLPPADVFYQFLGDIKLYQDRGRKHEGPLIDLGLPRRVAIRRRMVNTMVAVFREHYDRWYVLAHSLGTVVALNGLMETAHALPNYLPYSTWKALQGQNVFGIHASSAIPSVQRMWPERPTWISNDRQVLERAVLFRKLRGLVTYGSPLDKYAYLWPQIANINKDSSVFADDFEWINVYDQTDPVAARLTAYKGAFGKGRSPVNLAYKAHWAPLYSHTKYLSLKRGKPAGDLLARRLLDWMLGGGSRFPRPKANDGNWYKSTSSCVGFFRYRLWMWLLAMGVLASFIGGIVNPALLDAGSLLFDKAANLSNCCSGFHESGIQPNIEEPCCENRAASSGHLISQGDGKLATLLRWLCCAGWVHRAGFVLLSATLLVGLCGGLRWLIESRLDKRRDAEICRAQSVDTS